MFREWMHLLLKNWHLWLHFEKIVRTKYLKNVFNQIQAIENINILFFPIIPSKHLKNQKA